MTILKGHRCITLWFILLLTLISVVIYLDGGFEKQPYVMFVFFAVSDVLYVSSIIWIMISATTYNNLYSYLYNQGDKVAQIVGFLLKITFECFLFAKIVLHKEVPLFMLLSPLWLILTIAIVGLSKRMCSKQR